VAKPQQGFEMTTAQPDLPDVVPAPADSPQLLPLSPPRDVDPRLYPTVIREMIRHENDVTNHRIMWLLIVQGLLVNAHVAVRPQRADQSILAVLGILVTLSTFVLLYKSYHARGYLMFLGRRAKHGVLTEQQLPMVGWPKARIPGWRQGDWICPWLDRVGDLLEPYFFLPVLLNLLWVFELLRQKWAMGPLTLLVSAVLIVLLILAAVCAAWLWLQGTDAHTPAPAARDRRPYTPHAR
jgi:hypothetical protein